MSLQNLVGISLETIMPARETVRRLLDGAAEINEVLADFIARVAMLRSRTSNTVDSYMSPLHCSSHGDDELRVGDLPKQWLAFIVRRTSMQNTVLHAPIACPECAKEVLTEFRAVSIAQALATGEPIRLFASCHYKAWTASSVEREQLREYLDAAILSGSPAQHALKSPAPPCADP
jgi:hypothetical protein